jgi:hypothetical protein
MSNTGAQDLYRAFGFVPAGARKAYYADNGEDALVMWAHDICTPDYLDRLTAQRVVPGARIERLAPLSGTVRSPGLHPALGGEEAS